MASTTAAVTAGSANGTSPPTPTIGSGSNDEHGTINFGSGATPATGAQVVFTSGAGWSGQGVTPAAGLGTSLFPLNAATAALGPWFAAWDGAGRILTISSTVAPTASQAVGTYVLSYSIANG